jgi:raffinose/stachyose/melibiose transport system permease protein
MASTRNEAPTITRSADFHEVGASASRTGATRNPKAHPPNRAPAGRRPKTSRPPGSFGRIGYLYILPAVAIYAVVVLVPIVHTVWLSLHDWNGLAPMTWAGLENYGEVLTDDVLRSSFLHAAVLVVFYSVIPVTLGLVLAALMSRHRIAGFRFFRTVLFLPAVVTPAVVAVTWKWIYAPDGSLNQALRVVGLDTVARPWLGDFDYALFAVGLIGTWVYFGLAMVLFLAGIQRLPTDMFEAARIDGASLFQEIRHVTIPSLRTEIVIVVTLTMIGALRTFELIYLTTKGGPGNETQVPALEIFQRAFLQGNIGSASAVAICLALVVLAVSIVIGRIGERRVA